MSNEYQESAEFQRKILSLYIRKPEQVRDHIEPAYFPNPIHAEIARRVSEKYKKHPNTRLTKSSLRELVRHEAGSVKDRKYKDEAKALFADENPTDDDFVAERAAEFARVRKWRKALLEGERDVNAGHYDNALRRFEKLRQFSPQQGKIFHSYSDFKNARPLSFAIEGFLQNDAATMIGGLSGHGKTWIMLSMAKALLTGKPLWKHFKVPRKSHHVIYLIPESSIGPFWSRLEKMGLEHYVKRHRLRVHTLSAGPKPKLDDPRLLAKAKWAHIFLDTAIRFGEGEENSASDNQKLSSDLFGLLSAGARSIVGAHHSPKDFAKQNIMTLENVLRGTGDIGAILATAWGIKQLDRGRNIVHIENVKPRDFEPCGPFQIIGRPYIDRENDFRMHKRPGACGTLAQEQPKSGATPAVREKKQEKKALTLKWSLENPKLNSTDISEKFKEQGITVDPDTVRKYRSELRKSGEL